MNHKVILDQEKDVWTPFYDQNSFKIETRAWFRVMSPFPRFC